MEVWSCWTSHLDFNHYLLINHTPCRLLTPLSSHGKYSSWALAAKCQDAPNFWKTFHLFASAKYFSPNTWKSFSVCFYWPLTHLGSFVFLTGQGLINHHVWCLVFQVFSQQLCLSRAVINHRRSISLFDVDMTLTGLKISILVIWSGSVMLIHILAPLWCFLWLLLLTWLTYFILLEFQMRQSSHKFFFCKESLVLTYKCESVGEIPRMYEQELNESMITQH